MKSGNKILLIVFIFLLIIVVYEGYYFFILTQQPVVSKKSPVTNSVLLDSDSAINIDVLSYLKVLKKGVLISSILDNQSGGSIVEINSSGGKTAGGFLYKLKIVILGQEKMKNEYYYSKDDLLKIKFLEKNNEKIIAINSADLKAGDFILINEKVDMTKNKESALISTEIIKTNDKIK